MTKRSARGGLLSYLVRQLPGWRRAGSPTTPNTRASHPKPQSPGPKRPTNPTTQPQNRPKAIPKHPQQNHSQNTSCLLFLISLSLLSLNGGFFGTMYIKYTYHICMPCTHGIGISSTCICGVETPSISTHSTDFYQCSIHIRQGNACHMR